MVLSGVCERACGDELEVVVVCVYVEELHAVVLFRTIYSAGTVARKEESLGRFRGRRQKKQRPLVKGFLDSTDYLTVTLEDGG